MNLVQGQLQHGIDDVQSLAVLAALVAIAALDAGQQVFAVG